MIAGLALSIGKVLLGYAESRADKDLERFRIEAGVDKAEISAKVELAKEAAGVVKAGMQFRVFWIAWSIAAFPTSAWFGWGMLDSAIMNGMVLPDVAELPPQLQRYADVVWDNIFYSGAGLAGAQALSRAITRKV